jgi:hypothetical protein
LLVLLASSPWEPVCTSANQKALKLQSTIAVGVCRVLIGQFRSQLNGVAILDVIGILSCLSCFVVYL